MEIINNLKLILSLAFIMFLCFQEDTNAQETAIADSGITIKKMRLPILPQDKNSEFYSFDDEVAIIISEVVEQLGLYDVIVGILIDSTSENQDSTITKEMVVDFRQNEEFSEAIVVTETNIFQKGIPPEEEEAYFLSKSPIFTKSSKKDDEAHSDNIGTELTVLSYFIDIETGEFLGYFDVDVTHIGGSRRKSKVKAVKALKEKVMWELKKSYWFSAEIGSTENGKITLPLGTSVGIEKGMIFDLIEPDRIWTVDDEKFFEPGGIVGFASVVDTASDSSRLQILHEWQDHYPGSWAVEHPTSIFALQLYFTPPSINSYINFGLQLHTRPIHRFDGGIGMHILRLTDSFRDKDFGLGFSGFGIWKFFNMPRLILGGKLGVDIDIPFRKDDDGTVVHTALLSAHAGIVAEFPSLPKSDFILCAGYRFGLKADGWQYSRDDENLPAYWENGSPEVDNSGFMWSLGYKYFLF